MLQDMSGHLLPQPKDLRHIPREEHVVLAPDLFPEYSDEELPGVCLSGSRLKEGITQKVLSELTGIPQSHISEMENGKRQIGKKRAKILAKALNVRYKVLL